MAGSAFGAAALESRARELGQRCAAAFKVAVSDKEWFVHYLRAGAFLLIPVIGYIALLGWQKRQADAAKRERMDPRPISLDDVNAGVPLFVNALVLSLLAGVATAAVVVPLQVAGIRGWASDVGAVLNGLWVLALAAVWPEVMRRAFFDREPLALLRPAPSWKRIRKHPAAYLHAVLLTLVAWLVALAGINVLCVGALITLPMGHVIAAWACARWAKDS